MPFVPSIGTPFVILAGGNGMLSYLTKTLTLARCAVALFVAAASPINAAQLTDETRASASQRPTGIPISFESEWIGGSDADLATQSLSLKLPILRLFGSPPPIVKLGVAYTDLSTTDVIDFDGELYAYSFGVSKVKKFNDRWTVRTILGMNFATDTQNVSSDAWRFTGGVFAIYRKSPELSWTFGALALGRSDVPVVPAVGAVWLPNSSTRVDLILPNPKINFLLSDDGERQNWAYLGGGFNGNTWGVERTDNVDDALTYRDWRLVAGLQSRPSAPANAPFVPGRKYAIEIGYAFARRIEFERPEVEIDLDDGFIFRFSSNF